MYCESCGTFIPDGQAYCTNCGAQAPIILAEPVQLPGSQPVKQPVNQPVNQPVSQPVGQPAYQSVEVDRYGTRNVSVEVPVQSVTNYMARAGLICGIVAMITTYIPYTNIRMSDGYILMFNTSQMGVLNSRGVEKYTGTVDGTINNFFKIGWNRYMLVLDSGVNVIKLS